MDPKLIEKLLAAVKAAGGENLSMAVKVAIDIADSYAFIAGCETAQYPEGYLAEAQNQETALRSLLAEF